jgi:hypothetical protein
MTGSLALCLSLDWGGINENAFPLAIPRFEKTLQHRVGR